MSGKKTFDETIADLLAGQPVKASGRPSFVAHPATWWEPQVVADHLAACRSSRGPDGEWKSWDELDANEKWTWYWELFSYKNLGPTHEVEVP